MKNVWNLYTKAAGGQWRCVSGETDVHVQDVGVVARFPIWGWCLWTGERASLQLRVVGVERKLCDYEV